MKMKFLILTIAAATLLVAVYLIWPESFGFCEKTPTVTAGELCYKPYIGVGDVLLPLTISLFAFSVLAFVTTKRTFSRWFKFTIGYAPVVAFLLFAMPSVGTGVGGFGLTYLSTPSLTKIYAVLYALISLPLLAISEFNERRKR